MHSDIGTTRRRFVAGSAAVGQRTACEAMLASMGLGATHDHAAEKPGGPGPMAMTHAQFRQMLGNSIRRVAEAALPLCRTGLCDRGGCDSERTRLRVPMWLRGKCRETF